MRNDQSTFTKEYGYLIDIFDELQDMRWSDLQYLDEYRELRMKKNDGLPIDQNRLNELEPIFKNKIPTSARWNKFQNALVGMQTFIKTEVEGFVLDKQNEMNTYVDNKQSEINQSQLDMKNYADTKKQEVLDYTDLKKSEVQTTVTNGQNAINATKDEALTSIERKKENIIDYMDSTTAGKIRNDIGIVGDLTTEDKSSLVNAINEVNAKEVDLTPIENKIGNLSEMTTTDKSNIVNAINEINAKEVDLEPVEELLNTHTSANITAHNVSRGTSSFKGNNQEVVIAHNLGIKPTSAYAFPTVNPEGYLGEVWIRMNNQFLYIGNSGSFTGAMSWTAIG